MAFPGFTDPSSMVGGGQAGGGLLGLLGVSSGDPNKDAALNHGLLQAGLSLMQARGKLGPALGQAGMVGLQSAQQYGQQQYQQQMQQAQMEELKRTQQMRALPQQFMRSPAQSVLAGGGGPTVANAAKLPDAKPSFDYGGYAEALAGFDPVQALQLKGALEKDTKPIISKPGDIARDPAGRVLWQNPEAPAKQEQSALAKLVAERNALPPNDPMRAVYDQAIQKSTTHQPPVSVSYGAPVAGIGPDGQPVFFQPTKDGRPPAIVPGIRPPAGADKKPTEFEAKAGLYFKSMSTATTTLDKLEKMGAWRVPIEEAIAPGRVENVVVTPRRQGYIQAQRQWIDSINRVRSGANLPELEYERAVKTFFPVYGDDEKTAKQKADARRQEEQAMRAAAGPALKDVPGAPPAADSGLTPDEKAELEQLRKRFNKP